MPKTCGNTVAHHNLHPVYRRTDTHWNRFVALVAYNAIVLAAVERQMFCRGG